MRKILSLLLPAALALSVLCVDVSAAESGLTALQTAEAMGYSWNLGNTMEACGSWISTSSVTNYETAWGANVTTEKSIAGLKSYGFGAVRIPVAWSNLMPDDGKYTINKELLSRIDEIVGYVLDNDMYAVVNIHWDGGWWDGFGDADKQNAAMEKYKAIWKQLSSHYKNYSEKLIFESANEELNGFGLSGQAGYDKVNEINQTFVDIVRASGGKNKTRCLLIAGYSTDIAKTCDSRFKMPADTVKNKLLISVHYYTPSIYCIADDPKNSWGYSDSWGTEKDKDYMWSDLSKMQKFTANGYGVIIGEYGVCKIKSGNSYTMKKGSADFIESMITMSAKLGYSPFLWDTPDNWYNRVKCRFNDSEIEAYFMSLSKKSSNTISGLKSAYIRAYSAKAAATALSPKALDGAKISYSSTNEKVVTVSKDGKVKLAAPGTAAVTVTASATEKYSETTKSVFFVVKPLKEQILSVKSASAGNLNLSLSRDGEINGIELQYGTAKDFSKCSTEVVDLPASANHSDKAAKMLSGLESGRKYYVRARAFVEYNGKKYYGSYSTAKAVTIK